MSTERYVVLGAGTVHLRRRLDPTDWAVFEQLLFESTDDGDVWAASVSVRRWRRSSVWRKTPWRGP